MMMMSRFNYCFFVSVCVVCVVVLFVLLLTVHVDFFLLHITNNSDLFYVCNYN